MIRGLVLCCLIAVALAAEEATCVHKGNIYKKGEAFKDDCNRCFCGGNNMVGCTKMLCRPHHQDEEIVPLKGDALSCDYKGKMYKKGEAFMDDCNHCFCGGNDMVGCTKMLCRPHQDEEIEPLKDDKATCVYKGITYKKGEAFWDDCNRCFCGGNAFVGCTEMLCKPYHLQADEATCVHNGKTYKKGEAFRDDCNRCFCGGNNMVGCTKMLCKPHHQDEEIVPLKGDAESCDYKGKMYKKGDRFMDDCNHCFCGGNDMVGCTKMLCRPHQDEEIVLLKDDKATCVYKGITYKKGEAFWDDCNRCFCGGNAFVGCTEMLCKPYHLQADEATCVHNGKTYKKGEAFRDDCNRCFCGGNNMIGCTKMLCKPHHQDEEIVPLKGDAESCDYKGKMYKKGDRFMDDCNHCFCGGNDMVGCTKMLCIHSDEKPQTFDEILEDSESCTFRGKTYRKGENFKDDCNICFCGGNNVIGCTIMMCPLNSENTAAMTCTHKGKTYNMGDNFKDDCNTCFCSASGHVGCTRMMCIHPEEQTLEDSDSCNYKGKTYTRGDHFKDDCNVCFCGGEGIVGCTLMICPPKENVVDYKIATCTHKGKTYNIGDSFKDDCNSCHCAANGNAVCTLMMCIHPEQAVDYKIATCTHKGKTYNIGDSFKDDCNSCLCSADGNAVCTLMMCVHPEQADSETCTDNGKVYQKGDSFPSSDGCNSCFCAGNNNIGCTRMACRRIESQSADSETCTQNGKVYQKGESFPSSDGCNRCFCGGNNNIGCTKMACRPKGCLNNGKLLGVGEHYKKDCNTCICTRRGGICTKKACLPY